MSLWGGFDQPSSGDDCGLEKRLELDLTTPLPLRADSTTVQSLCSLLAAQDGPLQEIGEEHVLTLAFPRTLAILGPEQWVFSAHSDVLLHELLKPLVSLLTKAQTVVCWASFFRKNTAEPWGPAQTSDVMAQEYAELKCAFPSGQSFLTGPVDGDHYFHFVYDQISHEANPEEDAQLNIFMHDVVPRENGHTGKYQHRVSTHPSGHYELLRTFAQPHVSFETNNPEAVQRPRRCEALLAEYRPERFTATAVVRQDRDTQPLLQSFNSYSLQHRSVNYLREGYMYLQVVFVRDSYSSAPLL